MKVISSPLTINAASPATFARAGTAWYWDYAGVLQSAGTDVLRFNWDKQTGEFDGVLIEDAATNLLFNNATLSTQTRTGFSIGATYVVSFYGTGSVQMTAGVTGSPKLDGTGASTRVQRTFIPSSTSVTFTVTGSVTYGQCELGPLASSVIPTAGAAVTRPADVITGTGVFYNGFVDSTATYAGGATYALGAVVQYGGRLYESLQASNTGHQPDTSPTWWLDTNPTNNTAAFDLRSSTRSVGNNTEEVVCIYSPSNVDAVGVANMANCNYVQVLLRYLKNWRPSMLYKDSYPRNAFMTSATPGRYITVVVNNAAGGTYPEIGEIVLGTAKTPGTVELGASWSLVDYSKVDEDAYGNVTFTRGKNTKLVSTTVKVATADYNWVTELMADLTATPTMWEVTDVADYEAGMLVFGFAKRAAMSVPRLTDSTLSLDIQGLT